LSAVHVPEASDEAMRDLCRARTDAVQDLRRSRAQLKAFLLRHGYRDTGKSAWSERTSAICASSCLPHPAQRVVLEDACAPSGAAGERIARLEEAMAALLESWPMKPVVEAVMGLRGFARVGAMVLVSELGGAWRFDHPRQLMAYLGPGADGKHQLRQAAPGAHHQDRQRPCALALDRGRAALPAQSQRSARN
jgi:transposase